MPTKFRYEVQNKMRSTLLLIVLVVLFGWMVARIEARRDEQTIMVDGVERRYALHVPASLPSDQPSALVMVLHGGGGRGSGIRSLTKFDDLADEKGFMVVYPDGLNRHWNDGRENGRQSSDADDVGFIRALIDHLSAEYKINHVFVTGISNGGFMTYRLVCELADRITAAAAVTATLMEGFDCTPSQPVPMLVMNGTVDPLVPYAGGEVGRGLGKILSTEATLAFWAQVNGCSETFDEVTLADADPEDETRVIQRSYSDCGAPVVLYRVEGGGHTWPGGAQYLPKRVIGLASQDIDATRVIWDFFAGGVAR